MSDVLSADEVRELLLAATSSSRARIRLLKSDVAALARSHEQLRGERDAAEKSAIDWVHAIEKRAEAAARAGEAAADALREIARVRLDEDLAMDKAQATARLEMRRIARDALSAYDRAVSGQTAEKEEA